MPRNKSRLEVELDQLTGKTGAESEVDITPKHAQEDDKEPTEVEDEIGNMIVLAGPGGEKTYDDRSPASFVEDMLKKGVEVRGILAVASQIRKGAWRSKVKTLLEAKGYEIPKPKKATDDEPEGDEPEDEGEA